MMDQDGMVSSSNIIGKCEQDFMDGRIDDANWFKDDMTDWLARYEQLEQDNKNIGKSQNDKMMNVAHQNKGKGMETKCEAYEGVALNPHESLSLQNMTLTDDKNQSTLMVNPQSLLPSDEQQSQPGTLEVVQQKNAEGMNIPWLKATVSKQSQNSHGNAPSDYEPSYWTIKNITEIQHVPECRKLGIKCSCADANPKIVFRNKTKLQYVWDYNVHNEPSDAVKEVLVDQYMMRITCIINSYKPKTGELLRHKSLLLGQHKKSWILGGQNHQVSSSVPQVKNVTYSTYRGKRGTTHQVQKVWSSQSPPTQPKGTSRKRKDF